MSKYVVPLFCLKMHTGYVFFLRHVSKKYLSFIIEQWPHPGLVCETGPMAVTQLIYSFFGKK